LAIPQQLAMASTKQEYIFSNDLIAEAPQDTEVIHQLYIR
jgi:hypothetical protein